MLEAFCPGKHSLPSRTCMKMVNIYLHICKQSVLPQHEVVYFLFLKICVTQTILGSYEVFLITDRKALERSNFWTVSKDPVAKPAKQFSHVMQILNHYIHEFL